MACLTKNDIIANGGQVYENPNGTVSVFLSDGNKNGTLTPQPITSVCCAILGYTFDETTQKCKWNNKPIGSCDYTAPFNLVLNPNGNDGAIFTKELEETCTLTVDFDYLFKFDCNTLTQFLNGKSNSTCEYLTDIFEQLGASAVIDIIEIVNGNTVLTSVYEQTFFPKIGTGNLYTYLSGKSSNTGFYVCGNLTKNTADTDCYPLNLYNLNVNNDTLNCVTFVNQIISNLLTESGLSGQQLKTDIGEEAFSSNWLNFHTEITDQNIISLIENKKIKLSIKLSGSCIDSCVLLDNIKMDKTCTKVTKKDIFVTKNPSFELDRIIDNKKSWIANTETTHRTFNIAKYDGSQAIRYTDYYLEDERQVINTKEIDLDIDIAAAVETDVWCYVSDNPCILTGETIGTTFCTKDVGKYNTGLTTVYGTSSTAITITGLCITAGTEPTKYSCPAGFSATPANDACKKIESYTPVFLGSGGTISSGDTNADYSTSVRFYDTIQNNGALPVYYPYAGGVNAQLRDQTGGTISVIASSTTNSFWVSNGSTTTGRLNVAGISASTSQWLGFSECINITQAGTYYIGIASDDYCRFKVNGQLVVALTGNSGIAPCYTPQGLGHQVWSVFPFYLNSGVNLIEMEGLNWPQFGQPTCPSGYNSAAFAAEIYKPTSFAVLTGATGTGATQANVIFTTKNKIGKYYDISSAYSGGPTTIGYNCPYGVGYSLNKCDAVPTCTRVTTSAITTTPAHSITGFCNEVRAITSSTVVYTYQTGTYSCPAGFSATPGNDACQKITNSNATPPTSAVTITAGYRFPQYGILGAKFFSGVQNSGALPYYVPYTPLLAWPLTYQTTAAVINQTGGTLTPIAVVSGTTNTFWANFPNTYYIAGALPNSGYGRLNQAGISTEPTGTQFAGFSQCINITQAGTYYIGLAADNYALFKINGQTIFALTGNSQNAPVLPYQSGRDAQNHFNTWWVFEWDFTSGTHIIEMLGLNYGATTSTNPSAFAAEIYKPRDFNTLTGATTTGQTGLVFSTANLIGSNFQIALTAQGATQNFGYSCPSGYAISFCNGSAPTCLKIENTGITFTLANIPATATTSGYCRDTALTCVTPTITSKTQTTTVTTSQTITVSAITCEPKVYCCSDYCGDANININGLMTEQLSGITALEDFEYLITSELIDAKDRKTLSSYPTLRLLYERYMNSRAFCDTTSSKFDYYKMDKFANLIGSYWVDLIEQTIPATTIWGATKIYTNTIFDKQKFQYKGYSSFFGYNIYRGLKPLSPVTGDSCGVDVNTVFIKGASSATTLFHNEGDIHEYNNVYPLQMNSGSEFISVVRVIGPASPCGTPGVINECLLGATITDNIAKDGTITANAVGAIGNVTYLWSPTNETTQTIGNLSAGTTYTVTINDQCCEEQASLTVTCGLSLSVNATDPTFGLNNGSLIANVTGQKGTLSYVWTNTQTSEIVGNSFAVINLSSGTYNVVVTDSAIQNCTASTTTSLYAALTFNANRLNGFTATTVNSTNGFKVNYGNGTITTYPSGVQSNIVKQAYTTQSSSDVKILSTDISKITQISFTSNTVSSPSVSGLSINTSGLTQLTGLQNLTLDDVYVTGKLSELPRGLKTFIAGGQGDKVASNNLAGSTYDLPTGLTFTRIEYFNTISGDTAGIPRNLTYIDILGDNTISGSLTGMPQASTFKIMAIGGNSTIYGNVSQIPRYATYVLLYTSGVVSGNTLDFPTGINSSLIIEGPNVNIAGAAADIPSTVKYLSLSGTNTITGTVTDLPTQLIYCALSNNTKITGNTSDFPSTLTTLKLVGGDNQISGNIANFPSQIKYLTITGGTSPIYGNVSSIPNTVTILALYEGNTLSGNTSSLTSKPLVEFSLYGSNTLAGSVNSLPTTLEQVSIGGNNTVTGYTAGYNWNTSIGTVVLLSNTPGVGFTNTAIDNILIDLNNRVTNWTRTKSITLKGIDTPKRTSYSNSAVNTLTGSSKGVTIILV